MFRINLKNFTKFYTTAIVIVVLALTFYAGVFYGYENRPGAEKLVSISGKEPPPQFENADFSLFWDVWAKLEQKYVDKSKLSDREKLTYGAISGLVAALKDPYTEFMPPAETQQFKEDIKGSFGGIGAEIGIRKDILTIVSPLKGSPAEKAGLQAGDKIVKIDDTTTADLRLDEAVRLIRGPIGTVVVLMVFREGYDKLRETKIIRDEIRVPIIDTEVLPDGVFVIKLHHFTENAGFEFRDAVREFYSSKSKKLIFDLRNNPGGFLNVSVDIASWFIPTGDVVARERFASGHEELYRSNGYGLLDRIPAVVLINEGSASASEIVAGALRDHKRIPLIGSKSYGKGSVQEVEPMAHNASLKVTIAKWLTPNGTEIDGKGLEPDVQVEVTAAEREKEPDRDVVMEHAIEVLKGIK